MVQLSRNPHLVLQRLEFVFLVLMTLHFTNEFYGVELSVLVASSKVDFAESTDCEAVVDLIF